VRANAAQGRLSFTTSLEEGIAGADVIFIAVGTPSRRGDGHADLSYVFAAAREIAGALKTRCVIVTKSTVPVGTGDKIEAIMREFAPGVQISVASNPEFLREGSAVEDFKRPDRIVVGVNDDYGREVMANVYRPISLNRAPVMFTDRRSAEVIKYAANAFLALKITFINEMASFCEKAMADVQEVARGIGLDNRIGGKFLHAGPGYGGSCFPKDTLAMLAMAEEAETELKLVRATVDVNDARKRNMAQKVAQLLDGSMKGKVVGVLGLTFKPNTDDMRDAPSLSLIDELQKGGAIVRVHDPVGMENAKQMISNVTWTQNAYECAQGCDVLTLITEWDAFRALDFARLKQVMRQPALADLRNVYRHEEVARHGFRYVSVGRPRQDIL
jgi:UDPglucose 6-dehydrogenase